MAGTINVVGFPTSQKTPGVYIAVVLGGPGTSVGVAPLKILLIGQMITANITGSAPSFTVTAGTATTNTALQVFSASDALTKFGAGSELHLMAIKVFEQYPAATVWAAASPNATTSATGVITFTGSATAAVTCRVLVCGRFADTTINVGDSVTTMATNVATTINQQTNWPVTAQFALGVLTITSKNAGPRSNTITFRVNMIAGSTTTIGDGAALAGGVLNGVTATLSGGTAVGAGGVYRLSGGGAAESLTTLLSNVAATQFDRYAIAQVDSTNVNAVGDQMGTDAGVTIQLRQQAVFGSNDTLANVQTVVSSLSSHTPARCQMAWSPLNDLLPGEIAAQMCAARLIGDASAGGRVIGESTDPSANQDGMLLKTIPAQYMIGDRPTQSQVETQLNNGVCALVPTFGGGTMVARSITCQFKDAQGNPNYSVIDTEFVTVPDAFATFATGYFLTNFAGAKLAPDSTDGSGPKAQGVITPSFARATVNRLLKDWEQQARIINVDLHNSELQAIIDPSANTRLLMDVPIVPAPALHQTAANIRQLTA